MKKFFFVFLLLSRAFFAQVNYVEAQNKVYDFIDRLAAEIPVENYDSFERPATGTEIARVLKELEKRKNELCSTDRNKLEYFLTEFEYELEGATRNYSSLWRDGFSYLLGDKPKYLYFAADSNTGSVFVNFIGKAQSKYDFEQSKAVFPYIFGGKIELFVGKYFGAKIKATNGSYFGERSLLYDETPFKYNFKFTETESDNVGSEYFDETSGYLTFRTEYADFKIGSDRLNVGYGIMKTLFGNNAPRFDYLGMNLRYKNFRFSYFHGKLLGKSVVPYEVSGNSRRLINDKWIAYHRFALNLTRGTQLGAGETVVYYGRSADLSYLNPFNFYKSAEHANQDRDNSMLFFDFKSYDFIPRASFYITFVIDDIDFTKLGTDWYGNNFLLDCGFSFASKILPSDMFSAQAVFIRPYFYTHKFYDNNFTNSDFNLADNFEPNSFNLIFDYKFSLSRDLDFSISYLYRKHAANELDAAGNVAVNFGGDISVGHRPGDSEYVGFLEGVIETERAFEIKLRYEFIRNYDLTGRYFYSNRNDRSRSAFYIGIDAVL